MRDPTLRGRSTTFHKSRRKPLTSDTLPFSVVYDHFDGVDDTAMATRVPPVGPGNNAWATPGSSNWVTKSGRAEARFDTATTALLQMDMGISDVDMQVSFWFPATGNNRSAGILFHYIDTANYLYTIANLNNSQFRLFARVGGANGLLVETAFSFVAGVRYDMRLIAEGDRIRSSIDGVGTPLFHTLSASDMTLFGTSTRHGLRAANQSGGAFVTFDNLIVNAPMGDIPLGSILLLETEGALLDEDGSRFFLEEN